MRKFASLAGALLIALAGVSSAISAEPTTRAATPEPTQAFVLGEKKPFPSMVAGGNTGSCKASCDRQLDSCIQRKFQVSGCQHNWNFCNKGCEKNS